MMRVPMMAALVAMFLFLGHARAAGEDSAAKPAWTLSDLAWMAGDWQTGPGRAVSEEHWMLPAGGSMIGMSRTLAGDKVVSFEYLRIEQRGDAILYVASPKGRCPATDFRLTRLSNQEAIFENPQHDFPKRIIYRKGADGVLTAIVDGGEGTKSEMYTFRPFAK